MTKTFRWSPGKNDSLKLQRGISFEAMVVAVESGGLMDVLAHPNQDRYPEQKVMVIAMDAYVYLVPFVEEKDHLFLKTIIPSRKATRDYLERGDLNG